MFGTLPAMGKNDREWGPGVSLQQPCLGASDVTASVE